MPQLSIPLRKELKELGFLGALCVALSFLGTEKHLKNAENRLFLRYNPLLCVLLPLLAFRPQTYLYFREFLVNASILGCLWVMNTSTHCCPDNLRLKELCWTQPLLNIFLLHPFPAVILPSKSYWGTALRLVCRSWWYLKINNWEQDYGRSTAYVLAFLQVVATIWPIVYHAYRPPTVPTTAYVRSAQDADKGSYVRRVASAVALQASKLQGIHASDVSEADLASIRATISKALKLPPQSSAWVGVVEGCAQVMAEIFTGGRGAVKADQIADAMQMLDPLTCLPTELRERVTSVSAHEARSMSFGLPAAAVETALRSSALVWRPSKVSLELVDPIRENSELEVAALLKQLDPSSASLRAQSQVHRATAALRGGSATAVHVSLPALPALVASPVAVISLRAARKNPEGLVRAAPFTHVAVLPDTLVDEIEARLTPADAAPFGEDLGAILLLALDHAGTEAGRAHVGAAQEMSDFADAFGAYRTAAWLRGPVAAVLSGGAQLSALAAGFTAVPLSPMLSFQAPALEEAFRTAWASTCALPTAVLILAAHAIVYVGHYRAPSLAGMYSSPLMRIIVLGHAAEALYLVSGPGQRRMVGLNVEAFYSLLVLGLNLLHMDYLPQMARGVASWPKTWAAAVHGCQAIAAAAQFSLRPPFLAFAIGNVSSMACLYFFLAFISKDGSASLALSDPFALNRLLIYLGCLPLAYWLERSERFRFLQTPRAAAALLSYTEGVGGAVSDSPAEPAAYGLKEKKGM